MRRLVLVLSVLALAVSLLPGLAAAAPDEARVQPWLADQLAGASPTDLLTVFVHAADADHLDDATSAIATHGLAPMTTWDRIGVAVAAGTPAQVQALRTAPGVTYLEGDRPVEFQLSTSHEATRYEEVHTDQTFTGPAGEVLDGAGYSVAVIDSGVDGTHPMFQLPDGTSKVRRNLKSVCPFLSPTTTDPHPLFDACMVDAPSNDTDTVSAGGHGTHVAAIAGGLPVTTSAGEELLGAAPGADLISLSVGASLSIYGGNQGLYWVLMNHENPCEGNLTQPDVTECAPIVVTNNSYGPPGGGEYDPDGATAKLQDALAAEGVLTVWAAGNDGGDGSSNVVNPAAQSPTPGVLGVANYDDADSGTRSGALNASSSRGEDGRVETYPDVSAPGTAITAACRVYLSVCATGLDFRDPDYNTISGTSMAAPHVAGYVAVLKQADPSLTPAAIEEILEDTAHEFAAGDDYDEADPRNDGGDATSFDKGHGLVDMTAALAAVTGTDASDPVDACADGDGSFTDPSGDADGVIAGAGSGAGLPSASGLDVVAVSLAADGNHDVTFTVQVEDLPDEPGGLEGQGEYFDVNFSVGGGGFYITMNRNVSDGESFQLGRFETTRTSLAPLTGSFDPDADTITALLPHDAIATALGDDRYTVREGSQFSGLEVVARRDLFLLVPDADTASGDCPFVVGDGGTDEPTNEAPTASFTIDPTTAETGQTVTFDGSGSSDPDGDALAHTWDLGDGTSAEGTTVEHAYGAAGTYEVTLTVTDGSDSDTSTQQVEVVEPAPNGTPTASATATPDRPRDGEEVTFDGSGSTDPDGDTLTYEWDLGDGATATGQTTTHAYERPGRYTVTLRVTDPDGAADQTSVTVQVRGGGGQADMRTAGADRGVGGNAATALAFGLLLAAAWGVRRTLVRSVPPA